MVYNCNYTNLFGNIFLKEIRLVLNNYFLIVIKCPLFIFFDL